MLTSQTRSQPSGVPRALAKDRLRRRPLLRHRRRSAADGFLPAGLRTARGSLSRRPRSQARIAAG
jgi:hypothetical protein